MDLGVISILFKNGLATIAWSDGTKASRVEQAQIDVGRAFAAKEAHQKEKKRQQQEQPQQQQQEQEKTSSHKRRRS